MAPSPPQVFAGAAPRVAPRPHWCRRPEFPARVAPERKARAERVLERLGLSATTAITLYYEQILLRRGIPFDIALPNATTQRAMRDAELRCRSRLRNSNLSVTAGDALVDRARDGENCGANTRPTCRTQHDERYRTANEVLLITQVAVRRDEHFKPRQFRRGEQFTIRECRPSALERRLDGVRRQPVAQRHGSPLVE